MQSLRAKEMIRFGWETFKKRPWVCIGITTLNVLISAVSSGIASGVSEQGWTFAAVLVNLVDVLLVQILLSMGLLAAYLRAHESIEAVSVRDLWAPEHYWKFLGAYLLSVVIIIAGFVALIVPGIILSMVLYFVGYVVMDRGVGPLQALSESARITKGHRWELFVFSLALAGLNILGFLALLVGLFVTVPVTFLAIAHAYRTLEHQASEVVPVAAA